jgi:hypothetical protein
VTATLIILVKSSLRFDNETFREHTVWHLGDVKLASLNYQVAEQGGAHGPCSTRLPLQQMERFMDVDETDKAYADILASLDSG